MKVLFVGAFNRESTNNSQAQALERAGCLVLRYDYRRAAASLRDRVERDEQFSCLCRASSPDVVFFSKCNDIGIEVVRRCNEVATTVLWYMDPLNDNFCPSLLQKIRECHLSCFALQEPYQVGQRHNPNSVLLPEGFDPDVDRPVDVPKRYDVTFIGSLRGERAVYQKEFGFHVYGNAYGTAHAVAVGESRINLNFTEGGTSDRTYKVLAAGGFLLTQPWPAMEQQFEVGRDFDVFSSPKELRRKIDFYLARPDLLAKIAARGMESVERFSRDRFAEQVLAAVRSTERCKERRTLPPAPAAKPRCPSPPQSLHGGARLGGPVEHSPGSGASAGHLFVGSGPYSGLYSLDFGIRAGDRVLDVGGGHKPYPLATHVVDMPDETHQRHYRELAIGDRELIAGDVCEVLGGFSDDYFDFCYCSHVFEHMADLPLALDLIGAKCARGFYAVPASDFEFLTAKPHFGHVNLCRLVAGVLHIAQRPPHTVIGEFGRLFEQKLFSDPEFNRLWEGHDCRGFRFIWEARHYWEGKIDYEYHQDAAELYPQLALFKFPTETRALR